MSSNTVSERNAGESGTVKSAPVSRPGESGVSSEEKATPDHVELLRWTITGFVVLWLVVLVGLSWIGLRGTAAEVNRQKPDPTSTPTASPTPAASVTASPTPAASATATPTPAPSPTATPTPTASPTATQTVASAQVDAAAEANAGSTATPTPSVIPTVISVPAAEATQANRSPTSTPTTASSTPSSTPRESPSPTPSRQAVTFAARQHFVTLAVVTGTMVLFPWVLLLAFAYQQASRMYRDLEKDLEALGLFRGSEKMRLDLEKDLIRRIRAGFTKEYLAESSEDKLNGRASRLAKALASMAVGKGTGTGGPPPELRPEVGQEIYDEAQEISQLVAKEKKKDRTRTGLKQRFGWREFLLPLMSMTPIVLVCFIWAFWPEATFGFAKQMVSNTSLSDYFGGVVVKMAPAAVAVITAYLFMMFGLMRRYHRSDITPGGYWEVMNRLIVVFLLGLIGSVLLWGDTNGSVAARTAAIFAPTAAVALGIVAGVFPVGTLRFLVKAGLSRIRKWLAGNESEAGQDDLAKRLEQRHPLSVLDDLDAWDELRLTEEGVIGIQGMATADIAHLLIWTPFTTQQIVDWVDQSILFLAAGADPDAQYVRTFRKMGLRGASDLIDATTNETDRKIVVAAARAVERVPGKHPERDPKEDLITAAQLAASDVQRKVKDAQERVSLMKDKKKDDPLEPTKPMIKSAVSGIQDARESIESAVTRLKAGGKTLAGALDVATSLQAKFKTASEKAGDAENALASAAASDKVTEDLAAKLKALGEELTDEPDANSRAQALLDALNTIAKPFAQTEAKAREFAEKAAAIQKKAESTQTDVPAEVSEAESLLNSLTALAKEAQKQIKAESTRAAVGSSMDDLVKLLTDDGADKPKQLIDELKKKDEWTATGNSDKAKSYGNAEKLVGQAAAILKQVQVAASAEAAADKPSATAGVVASPPLTMEVLVTLLSGLERNPNLRRIQRYLTSEVAEILSPPEYKPNIDWLFTTTQGGTDGTRGQE